jgi:hypothetical protein
MELTIGEQLPRSLGNAVEHNALNDGIGDFVHCSQKQIGLTKKSNICWTPSRYSEINLGQKLRHNLGIEVMSNVGGDTNF